jgi:NDP-sugar pyrophosphorylase family protein
VNQDSQRHSSKTSTQLVVMAAGMGSRYGGLKQIDPIGPAGENILDYSVYDAIRAGFDNVIFVIREEIADIFKTKIGDPISRQIPVAYVMQELSSLPAGYESPAQRTKPWGTAHAVLCAAPEISGPFAAINADDFYGGTSFQILHDYLTRPNRTSKGANMDEYCLVGYQIEKTLSEHGHVSRGVCEVDSEGRLVDIVEHTRIENSDGGVCSIEGDESRILPAGTIVSMNLWGFSASFATRLEEAFEVFFAAHGNELKTECYLPSVVNDLVHAKKAEVAVLPTDEQWFGVTYQADKQSAKNAITERISAGLYPEKLWP